MVCLVFDCIEFFLPRIEIEDDFGFETLQLAYEIIRPDYLNVEPYISMFIIPDLIRDTTKQHIKKIRTRNVVVNLNYTFFRYGRRTSFFL